MVFGSKGKGNIVQINSVNDLKSRKIKPSDLGKKFIDKEGQEYKLKYDPVKKKVTIIKVIKGILDGKFMKDKFDSIATDEKVREDIKKKLGLMGKQFLKEKYHIGDEQRELYEPPVSQPQEEQAAAPLSGVAEKKLVEEDDGAIKSADDIPINSIEDISSVVKKLSDRLEIAIKNIYESKVFEEGYNYDDKIMMNDIRSLIRSDIIEEFKSLKERYEDIFKGYDDSKLENKKHRDDLKNILKDKNAEEKLSFLRELHGLDLYKENLESIIKAFNKIEYKLSTISETRITAKTFHERQKFSDSKFSLNTCKKDVMQILKYIKKSHGQKLGI